MTRPARKRRRVVAFSESEESNDSFVVDDDECTSYESDTSTVIIGRAGDENGARVTQWARVAKKARTEAYRDFVDAVVREMSLVLDAMKPADIEKYARDHLGEMELSGRIPMRVAPIPAIPGSDKAGDQAILYKLVAETIDDRTHGAIEVEFRDGHIWILF
jgi:hypothetical protein